MRIATACAALALELANAGVRAQAAGDAMEKLRACSRLAEAERLDCLEKLSREMAPLPSQPAPSPPVAPAPAADNWIVSETVSPIDYSPVAIATASSGGADSTALQLSIQCRGGRTELVIAAATLTRRGEDYLIGYSVNNAPPVTVATGTPAAGAGVGIKGDVVRLLTSLPDAGEIAFRVSPRQGAALEGRYALAALKAVLSRLAGPCKWPAAAGAPRK
jgi:hypothetical protein